MTQLIYFGKMGLIERLHLYSDGFLHRSLGCGWKLEISSLRLCQAYLNGWHGQRDLPL